MLKTYETIGTLNRSIPVLVNGARFDCVFRNGVLSPRKIQGRYSTANQGIQEALESSPSFNVRYKLVSTVKSPLDADPEKQAKVTSDPVTGVPLFDNADVIDEEIDDDLAKLKIAALQQPGEPNEDDLGVAPEPNEPAITIVGDEVTNAQKARTYLMQNYQVRFADLPNTDAIIKKAKELNVCFEKWEAFK